MTSGSMLELQRMSPDGCCHKTRILGAPCPLGWKCPFPNRLPVIIQVCVPHYAIYPTSCAGKMQCFLRAARKAVLMAAVTCLREIEIAVIENWRNPRGVGIWE